MRLLGTDIRFHWSIVIPFGITCFVPENLIIMLVIFLSVVLHEYGHVFACRIFGNDCESITLSAIGGMAVLKRDHEKPVEEFLVALCGPLVSFMVAAFAFPLGKEIEFWAWVTAVNGFILLFNLIPAFPMDGGRMLRSVFWLFTSKETATYICASLSVVLASLGMCVGIAYVYVGLVVASLFIGIIAASEFFPVDNPENV